MSNGGNIMSSLDEKFEKAYDNYENHQIDEALKLFEELFEEEYDLEKIIPPMIDLYLATDDLEKGEECVDILLKDDSENLEALSIKSYILTHMEKFEDALEYAEKIIELDPNVEEGYLLKISIYHLQNRTEDINNYVDELVEERPEVIDGIKEFTGLGPEDLKTGIVPEFDDEVEEHDHSECDHDHHHHHHDDECEHYDEHHGPNSDDDYECEHPELHEHDHAHDHQEPMDEETINNMLKEIYEEVDANTDDEVERNLYKANGAAQFSRFEESLDFIDEALKIDDKNMDALLLKSAILFNLTKFDEALTTIDNVIELYPDNTDALTFKGFVYLNLGDFKEAENSFKAALDLDDDDFEVWRQYSFAVASGGDMNRAIGINQKALKKFPEESDLWYDRYNFLNQIDSKAKAQEALDKCLELNPNQLDYQGNPVSDDNSDETEEESDFGDFGDNDQFDLNNVDLNNVNPEDIELSPEEERLFTLLSENGYDSQKATNLVLSSYQEVISQNLNVSDEEELFKKVVDLVEKKIHNGDI